MAQGVEVQRVQKEVLDNIKDGKELDSVRKTGRSMTTIGRTKAMEIKRMIED